MTKTTATPASARPAKPRQPGKVRITYSVPFALPVRRPRVGSTAWHRWVNARGY